MSLQEQDPAAAGAREQAAENGIQEQMQMKDGGSRSLGAHTQAEMNATCLSPSSAAARRSIQTVQALTGLAPLGATGGINKRVCRAAGVRLRAAEAKTGPPAVV